MFYAVFFVYLRLAANFRKSFLISVAKINTIWYNIIKRIEAKRYAV